MVRANDQRLDTMEDIARVILQKLDAPRRKSDVPIKPIIAEFLGLPKSGKDTQANELDRWFRRLGFQVLIHQESAETRDIRAMPRLDPYAYEMRHSAYSLSNLLSANTNRDFHLIILNRGIFDTLSWLEWNKRKGGIRREQAEYAKAFLLNDGPWIESLDGIFYIMCTVETALEREYGNASVPVFGARMNPEALTLMYDCVESVYADVTSQFPHLPIMRVDTTARTIPQVTGEIISYLVNSAARRMGLGEEDVLPWSIGLMREKALIHGAEIKVRGLVDDRILRSNGWDFQASYSEADIYLALKDGKPLENNECFHVRQQGGKSFFIYKREAPDFHLRARVLPVPIPDGSVSELIAGFDIIVTLHKEREIFTRDGFVLTRDRVKELGSFTEIRAPTPDRNADLGSLVRELGFGDIDVVQASYLRLYLTTQGGSRPS